VQALEGIDIPTLAAACEHARGKVEKKLKSVPKDPIRCAIGLRRLTQKLFSDMAVERKQTATEKYRLEPMLSFLELAIHHLVIVTVVCAERKQKKRREAYFFFEIVSLTLSNTLVGIRELTLAGLDNQARILFRYYIELAEMMLAIVGDKSAYMAFKGCGKAGFKRTTKYWREHLHPRKIRDSLVEIERSAGLKESYVQLLMKERRSTYRWLSDFSHCNTVTAYFGAYTSEIGKRWDVLRPSQGGTLTNASKATLYQLASYNVSFLHSLNALFLKHHGWENEIESDEGVAWITHHTYVFLTLFVGLEGRMGTAIYGRRRKGVRRQRRVKLRSQEYDRDSSTSSE
jgi:hypothetical protein